MLPVIVFVAVAIPALVIAFVAIRRRTTAEETPAAADAATQEEYEDEFEQAEKYQEKWRTEHHEEVEDDRFY